MATNHIVAGSSPARGATPFPNFDFKFLLRYYYTSKRKWAKSKLKKIWTGYNLVAQFKREISKSENKDIRFF